LEDLRTERLTLVALTPELARAAMEDRAKLERMLGARVPEARPGADFATMLPRIARGVEQIGVERKRLTVYTVDRNLIGETEFHGPPDRAGTVEVGYSIVPDYRGRGFASEATRTLIEHAFDRSGTYAGSPPSASTTTTPR
jgi:ribosomal-protein-alanine N-acetyltransferase